MSDIDFLSVGILVPVDVVRELEFYADDDCSVEVLLGAFVRVGYICGMLPLAVCFVEEAGMKRDGGGNGG